MEEKHAKITVGIVWLSDTTKNLVDEQVAFCSAQLWLLKFSHQMFFSSLWQPKWQQIEALTNHKD